MSAADYNPRRRPWPHPNEFEEIAMTMQFRRTMDRDPHQLAAVLRQTLYAGIAALTIAITGCATQGGTGAAVGTGIGALAGQLIGGDTEATLIGSAVGAGIGYLIGNERDKENAARMRASEVTGGLAGTRWEVVDWSPRDSSSDFASKIVEFRPDGQVVTTTTYRGGQSRVESENYRVAGDTLIVNRPGYVVNYRFAISGNQMTVNANRVRATLRRV
jgi:hypothetical protein